MGQKQKEVKNVWNKCALKYTVPPTNMRQNMVKKASVCVWWGEGARGREGAAVILAIFVTFLSHLITEQAVLIQIPFYSVLR